ncbi:MAG: SGNH/GDSL hydrolase family protein [Prevotella sp.]
MKHKSIIFALLLFCIGMQAQTKSVSILGDSYSTYEGFISPKTNLTWYHAKPNKAQTDVTDVKQMWWHKLITANGWKLCVNNSFSGSTICNTGYNKADYSDRSFITRMDDLGSPDIIFIFGATNDSWAGSPLGEYRYDAFYDADLYSFRPAMAYMLSYMTERYLSAEIYFLLNSGLKEEINESVMEICRHYGVTCISLGTISKKSGHPTIKGQAQIAEQISEALGLKTENRK